MHNREVVKKDIIMQYICVLKNRYVLWKVYS